MKNRMPGILAIDHDLVAASLIVTKAATSVPIACAKNGAKKWIGLNKAIELAKPSGVERSAPEGSGITPPLILSKNKLHVPPIKSPAIIEVRFLMNLRINQSFR